jgi:excinuclease ABC subunit A
MTMPKTKHYIQIKGARVNNLKNIDLEIPRGRFVVITGVSGSGKSSLAFDTLYAEGQRRYVESLSSYARQFLGRMGKPECDYIKGIPPAIAIEQKVISRNPRSTVGTSTEIYDYLRLLYAKIGHTISPVSGIEVKKHTIEDVANCMTSQEPGTKFVLLAPLVVHGNRTLREQLEMDIKEGYSRLEINGEIQRIDDYLAEHPKNEDISPLINIVVDRMSVSTDKAAINRLMDSTETAFYEGNGRCMLRFFSHTKGDGRDKLNNSPTDNLYVFSTRYEADGTTFEEPHEHLFSFNSPVGACPECEGFGKVMGIDERLVIPDQELSVYGGAVICWRGEKMGQWKDEFVRRAERYNHFPIFTPYYALTQDQKDVLWHGMPGEDIHESVCIDSFFQMVRDNQYKIQYRVMLSRFRGKTICPMCHGTRLKKEATYVKVGGRAITELVEMPVTELIQFFDQLELNDHDKEVSRRIMVEIKNRLGFLNEVGLGYLTLNRLSNSLSGGESQRINLATSLGSNLVGSLYILDEPSIGLHSRDTQRLIHVLRQLQRLGNTVVVVEHDEEIIREADLIIDIGPDAGRLGGRVVWQGDYRQLDKERLTPYIENATTPDENGVDTTTDIITKDEGAARSYTVKYLLGLEEIRVPESRRPWNNYILVKSARENNLKGIDVKIPLNVMTVVTGVSGSGKSTLVRDILYRALKRHLDEVCDSPGQYAGLEGDLDMIKKVEFVDQNPIGTSTRSNPVTYLGAYDEIRKLMSQQQLARQMGFTAAYFSFNTEGGRCEECKGEGTVTVEMQFMADLVLECEACHGKRFKDVILDVKYHGQNIYDILNMTVNQAVEFFTLHKEKKICDKLRPLQDVGLGYIKLGQTSSTLSGGENQRVKLAYYLSQEKHVPTLFIFDEPTTGLHFHDINKLLSAFQSLITRGHSIIIIEHNMDIIKCADHIIDLGPEGGKEGGYIVAEGTPEEVAKCEQSHTGQFLKSKLKHNVI